LRNTLDNETGVGEGQVAIMPVMCHLSIRKNRTRIPTASADVLSESNGSDKGLDDWILDEELMNPPASFVAFKGNSGEELLSTGEKERGGN
jgi:hypothetical protein